MAINSAVLSIVFSAITFLGVLLTFFRLGFRLKIQRFWWEDLWAAVASLCALISIASVIVVITTNDHASTLIASRIKAYMYTSVIWSVRMSIIFSIVRVTPSVFLRRVALGVAACFVLFWGTTIALQTWWCVSNTKTLSTDVSPNCVVPTFIAVFEVTTNVVADVVTIVLSIKLLRGVRLPRRQHRMMLYLFTASRFLCAFSLAHSISQLVASQTVQGILAYLQVSVFMVVCNLIVVVTYLYRVFWSPRGEDPSQASESSTDDDDFTTPAPRKTESLTTVDIESLMGLSEGPESELGSVCHSVAQSTNLESQNGLAVELRSDARSSVEDSDSVLPAFKPYHPAQQ